MTARKIIQKRKPGPERRLEIARIASGLFAEHGFSVSTRDISQELGITQAALYKHFKSKEELIEEVFRIQYLEDKPSSFVTCLSGSQGSLQERLTSAYTDFFFAINKTSMKLFHRASYDGLDIAKRYSPHLDERIIFPVLEELRKEAELPALAERPHRREERELILMLHSTIVFLAIRKHVYNIDFNGNESGLVSLNVRTWLAGARIVIHELQS